MPDCEKLKDMTDVGRYVDALVSETGFKAESLSNCKTEICGAVYGTGNPDISGIGVAIGYGIETALAVLLSGAVILLGAGNPRSRRVLTAGLRTFFDAAAYFAIAVQLATIAVLVQKDFGISTSNFEAIESQIAQAISVICMLPLMYPLAVLSGTDSNARHNRRLFLLNVGVALSFYPFLSRCIHAFSYTPLRDGAGDEVAMVDWAEVEEMCFLGGLDKLRTNNAYASIGPLELVATLVVYIFTIWHLLGLLGPHIRNKERWWGKALVQRAGLSRYPVSVTAFMVVPLGFAVPLLWVVFYLRRFQRDMAKSISQDYEGDRWGFGQVVSIVIFAPVAVDMFYQASFSLG